MKIERIEVFDPVTIKIESKEELVAIRDALFNTNDPLVLNVAKGLNAVCPRRKGKIPSHDKERQVLTISEMVRGTLAASKEPRSSADICHDLITRYSVKRQSIQAELTRAHQAGILLREKGAEKDDKMFYYTYKFPKEAVNGQ